MSGTILLHFLGSVFVKLGSMVIDTNLLPSKLLRGDAFWGSGTQCIVRRIGVETQGDFLKHQQLWQLYFPQRTSARSRVGYSSIMRKNYKAYLIVEIIW